MVEPVVEIEGHADEAAGATGDLSVEEAAVEEAAVEEATVEEAEPEKKLPVSEPG